jgi:hypothetical protein
MARKKLSRVIPVRVDDRDAIDLRRWARQESEGNVSFVVRQMIKERRDRAAAESASVTSPSEGQAA